jgi:hypothetical protein
MSNPDPEDYYIDINGGVHDSPGECVDASVAIESANSGGYPAGGNCGQDSSNIPDNKG